MNILRDYRTNEWPLCLVGLEINDSFLIRGDLPNNVGKYCRITTQVNTNFKILTAQQRIMIVVEGISCPNKSAKKCISIRDYRDSEDSLFDDRIVNDWPYLRDALLDSGAEQTHVLGLTINSFGQCNLPMPAHVDEIVIKGREVRHVIIVQCSDIQRVIALRK